MRNHRNVRAAMFLGVSIVLVTACASREYSPGFGYPFKFVEVSDAVKTKEGDLEPGSISQSVYDSLSRTFGAVRPPGSGSIAIRTRYPEGRSHGLSIAEGQWSTDMRETPKALLERLAAIDPDVATRGRYRLRRIDVRYWSESGVAARPRGHVYVEVVVETSADGQQVGRLTDPLVLETLASDFTGRRREALAGR